VHTHCRFKQKNIRTCEKNNKTKEEKDEEKEEVVK